MFTCVFILQSRVFSTFLAFLVTHCHIWKSLHPPVFLFHDFIVRNYYYHLHCYEHVKKWMLRNQMQGTRMPMYSQMERISLSIQFSYS
ncbi:hypothetical protein L1987_71844 [Smallanthus sonchifolius]|uniref:Uncharacterized protein n=1 Tax=Smallanthus sonchifolius TaxID=185202 RepID=A0ACB9ATK1_9ASTR|nr:hypothetical protein L1987_71844 [Smallanthus sonchifolius]